MLRLSVEVWLSLGGGAIDAQSILDGIELLKRGKKITAPETGERRYIRGTEIYRLAKEGKYRWKSPVTIRLKFAENGTKFKPREFYPISLITQVLAA